MPWSPVSCQSASFAARLEQAELCMLELYGHTRHRPCMRALAHMLIAYNPRLAQRCSCHTEEYANSANHTATLWPKQPTLITPRCDSSQHVTLCWSFLRAHAVKQQTLVLSLPCRLCTCCTHVCCHAVHRLCSQRHSYAGSMHCTSGSLFGAVAGGAGFLAVRGLQPAEGNSSLL